MTRKKATTRKRKAPEKGNELTDAEAEAHARLRKVCEHANALQSLDPETLYSVLCAALDLHGRKARELEGEAEHRGLADAVAIGIRAVLGLDTYPAKVERMAAVSRGAHVHADGTNAQELRELARIVEVFSPLASRRMRQLLPDVLAQWKPHLAHKIDVAGVENALTRRSPNGRIAAVAVASGFWPFNVKAGDDVYRKALDQVRQALAKA